MLEHPRETVIHSEAKALTSTALPDDFARMVDGEEEKAAYQPRGLTFSIANKLPSPSNAVFKKNVRWKAGEEETYETLYEATVDFHVTSCSASAIARTTRSRRPRPRSSSSASPTAT